MSACVGYGSQNMDSGELFINCHLLKKIFHNPLAEDERIQLDVVEMVCFKFYSEESIGSVSTSENVFCETFYLRNNGYNK